MFELERKVMRFVLVHVKTTFEFGLFGNIWDLR